MGLVVLTCAILTLTGTANLASVFQNEQSIVIVSTVATLDIACGLILILRNREIASSIVSHQKKTNGNANYPHSNPQTDNQER
jgi:hypothetical protein